MKANSLDKIPMHKNEYSLKKIIHPKVFVILAFIKSCAKLFVDFRN